MSSNTKFHDLLPHINSKITGIGLDLKSRKGVGKFKSCVKCLEYVASEFKFTKKSNNLFSSELWALLTKIA